MADAVSGCELLLSNTMEVRRLIGKPLQPARPIHRTVSDNGDVLMVNFQATFNDRGDGIKDHCNLWRSIGSSNDVFKNPVTEEPPINNRKDCELLLSNKMQVRSLIGKPLQPARPIRRTMPDNGDVLMVNFQATFADNCGDDIKDHCDLWRSIENSQDVSKVPVTEEIPKNKKDRITYSRDFLMQLSNVSVSKQKPKYLPDLPITLQRPVSSLHCATDTSCQS